MFENLALNMTLLPTSCWLLARAVYMIGNTLLVNLCIKGLMNDDPAIIKISLARIRSYIVFDFLAHHFDEGDGVILLLQRMDEGCPPGGPMAFERVTLACIQTKYTAHASLFPSPDNNHRNNGM